MNDCIIKLVEKDDNYVRSDVTNKKASELLNRIEENNAVNAEEQTKNNKNNKQENHYIKSLPHYYSTLPSWTATL
jgi:hypothetical protein